MVDINGPKQVDDTRGHLVGDRLLESTAQSLVRTFGRLPGSLVARRWWHPGLSVGAATAEIRPHHAATRRTATASERRSTPPA